jgi:hypothetical protein
MIVELAIGKRNKFPRKNSQTSDVPKNALARTRYQREVFSLYKSVKAEH